MWAMRIKLSVDAVLRMSETSGRQKNRGSKTIFPASPEMFDLHDNWAEKAQYSLVTGYVVKFLSSCRS